MMKLLLTLLRKRGFGKMAVSARIVVSLIGPDR